MIPLTLRPTDIGTPPAFQHLKDYCVFEDGEKIGRIYEVHAARSPEQAWFWSITALTPNPIAIRTSGHAASFEEAKAQLQGSLVASLEASAGMMRDDHGRRRTAMNNGLIYALGLLSIVGGLVVAAVLMWNLT